MIQQLVPGYRRFLSQEESEYRLAALAIIFFLAALGVRTILVFALNSWGLRWDEGYYYQLASRIATGYGFSFSSDVYFTGLANTPTSFQEPLFPLLVAAILKVFGLENLTAVYFVQAFLGAFVVVIIFIISTKHLGLGTGVLAGFAATFYPPLLFFGRLLMTDILFIFLLLLAILVLSDNGNSHISKRRAILGGLLIGLGALTRSTMMGVGIILTATYLAFGIKHRIPARVLLVRALLIMLATFITISPWAYRNYRVHNAVVPLSTKLGYNLYYYNYPLNDFAFNERVVPFPEGLKDLDEIGRYNLLKEKGLSFILTSPRMFLQFGTRKIIDFWRPLPAEGNSSVFERVVSVLSFPPVAVLGIGGLIAAIGKPFGRERLFALVAANILFLWMVQAAVFTGGFKARIAVEPLLIIFTSYFISRFVVARASKRNDFQT